MQWKLGTCLGSALAVVLMTGCATTVEGVASPAEDSPTAASPRDARSDLPGGAEQSCMVDDNCGSSLPSPRPAGLVCSPLPAAMTAFDNRLKAERGDLFELVDDVVSGCGYQVMVDVAQQYSNPFYSEVRELAIMALGEISAIDEGLRCAELQNLGLGPKQAVDYWVLWGAPDLMDADLNGVPCETVWDDVVRYMPAYY